MAIVSQTPGVNEASSVRRYVERSDGTGILDKDCLILMMIHPAMT
jgi:hypothetical protein